RLGALQAQLAPRALKGLHDPQSAALEVDIAPPEPEGFSPSQPEPDVQGPQGFPVVTLCCVQERPRLLRGQRFDLLAYRVGDHDQLRHVPRNQILAHRVLECRADDRVDLLDRGRALALPSLRPEELPQIRRGQLTQGLGAERGHDVVPDITFIRLLGRRAQPRFLDVAHPGFQECLHGKTARSRRDARAGRLLHLGELRADLFASLPVRRLPPTGAVRGENVRRTSPPTVLAPVDAALAVCATHATTGAGSRLSTYARRSVALTSRERPSLTLGSSPQRISSYTRAFDALS